MRFICSKQQFLPGDIGDHQYRSVDKRNQWLENHIMRALGNVRVKGHILIHVVLPRLDFPAYGSRVFYQLRCLLICAVQGRHLGDIWFQHHPHICQVKGQLQFIFHKFQAQRVFPHRRRRGNIGPGPVPYLHNALGC